MSWSECHEFDGVLRGYICICTVLETSSLLGKNYVV